MKLEEMTHKARRTREGHWSRHYATIDEYSTGIRNKTGKLLSTRPSVGASPSQPFFTLVENDFTNYDEQADGIKKFIIALYQLNPANMGEDRRAILLQQRTMCRNYLKVYRDNKELEEAEIKIKQDMLNLRNEERLLIVRSFIGI